MKIYKKPFDKLRVTNLNLMTMPSGTEIADELDSES